MPTGEKSYGIALFGMMPTAREEAETCIRRAMVWSIPLHSVCILVAAKNFRFVPVHFLY